MLKVVAGVLATPERKAGSLPESRAEIIVKMYLFG